MSVQGKAIILGSRISKLYIARSHLLTDSAEDTNDSGAEEGRYSGIYEECFRIYARDSSSGHVTSFQPAVKSQTRASNPVKESSPSLHNTRNTRSKPLPPSKYQPILINQIIDYYLQKKAHWYRCEQESVRT